MFLGSNLIVVLSNYFESRHIVNENVTDKTKRLLKKNVRQQIKNNFVLTVKKWHKWDFLNWQF